MPFQTVFLSYLRSRPIPASYRLVTDIIFCITTLLLLLKMERETQSGDTCPHYAVPRPLAGPSGVRLMERRPNSEPDTPCPPRPIRRVQPGEPSPACLERSRART